MCLAGYKTYLVESIRAFYPADKNETELARLWEDRSLELTSTASLLIQRATELIPGLEKSGKQLEKMDHSQCLMIQTIPDKNLTIDYFMGEGHGLLEFHVQQAVEIELMNQRG